MMKGFSAFSLLFLLLFSACDEWKIEHDLIFLHDYAARFQLSGGVHHLRYKELAEAHLALIETLELVRQMAEQKPEDLADDFEKNFSNPDLIVFPLDMSNCAFMISSYRKSFKSILCRSLKQIANVP